MKLSPYHIIATLATIVVGTVIVAAIITIESPTEVRKKSLDNARISHLQSLYGGIDAYASMNDNTLPESLDALVKTIDYGYLSKQIFDPETKEPYLYNRKSTSTFELCATFSLPSSSKDTENTSEPYWGGYGPIWDHPAGKHCFTLQTRKPTEF